MGQEFVVPSFNTNRYYNKNTENIAVLPTGLTAGMVVYVQSDGTLDGSLNHFWDNTNNKLLLGSSTTPGTAYGRAGQIFEVNVSANNGGSTLNTWSAVAATHASIFDFNRSKSSTIGTHTVVASGDALGFMVFRGSDGAAFQDAASIVGEVDGTPGASDMPGRLVFRTTPDGSATLTTRLTIDSLGRIQQQVGGATAQALTGSTFVVAKSQTGLTTVGSGRYFSLQNTSGSPNQVVEIGFGYMAGGVNQPVLIGHKVSDSTAFTKGSIYMAVRGVTTDTAPTEVWTLDSTGQVTQNMPAVASTAETLHTWTVSDDAVASLRIVNNTATNSLFIPVIRATGSGTSEALFIRAHGTTDTGAASLMNFDARIGLSTTVATRPLFQWTNNGTGVMILDHRGRFTLAPLAATSGTTAQFILTPGADTGLTASTESNVFRVDAATRTWATTGTVATQRDVMLNGMTYASASASQTFTNAATLYAASPIAGTNAIITNSYAAWFQANSIASTAEQIAMFNVSDDANSFLKVVNGTANDNNFSPKILASHNSTLIGLTIEARAVTDTGTNAITHLDSRIGTGTNVATRPAFQFSNNATIIAGFTGSTDGGRLIIGGNTLTPYGASGGLLEINKSAATSNISLNSWAGSSAGIGNILYFNKSRSSTVGAQTIVASGDFIGGVFWRGSDGASFQHAASIEAQVDGTPGTGDMPGRMVFYTSPDGAVTQTERVRISNRGNVILSLGAIAEPSTSVGTLVLTNTATAPTTSVDVVSLFSADVAGAGSASLALYTEQAVAVDVALASTHSLKVNINGTVYRVPLTTP